jgi:hypothetical protein
VLALIFISILGYIIRIILKIGLEKLRECAVLKGPLARIRYRFYSSLDIGRGEEAGYVGKMRVGNCISFSV